MSNADQSRRTRVEVAFDGVDITKSIQPYLLSITYTDNEEDEADDIQIKIHDREKIWMCQWLNDMVEAAAQLDPADGTAYKVIAKSGLNVRAGPNTSYKKLGALVYGTEVLVKSIENGWAAITYSGQSAYISASYIAASNGDDTANDVNATTGLRIQAVLIQENWNSDGKDKVLDCGQFELDSIDVSGPPNVITIKGTSLPYKTRIRQTKKCKAWEAYPLSGIAKDIASCNGMACLYESANDPFYTRLEQFKTSDIDFLSSLCHDAGISLKVTNNILVLFDQATYEAKSPVQIIEYGSGDYTKYKLNVSEADTQYTSCRISYTDPATGKTIEGIAYVEDYKEDAEKNQQLEVTAKVGSIAAAKELAKMRLRLHNKLEKTASFTLLGNPDAVAGNTIMLKGWGAWDGKYMIQQSKHSIGNSGYTTQVKLRRVLEGY